MVKKTFLAAAAVLTLALAGCGQLPSTARPNNASGLVVSVPAPEGVSSKFTLTSADLLFRVASGSEVFSGSVSLGSLASTAGPLNINLPHDGQWLVSAEWLLNGVPVQIGADVVTVTGNTPFDLEMGNLNSTCYSVTLHGDVTSYQDVFNFDAHLVGTSYTPGSYDIQGYYFTDPAPTPVISSTYFQSYPSPGQTVAYLGNGDWVNFTSLTTNTVFQTDSLAAKKAVLGSSAVMEVGDVYAVKISTGIIAWLQVQAVDNTANGKTVTFLYRLNRHGYKYMKFDVTAYGDVNCNTSGNILY